uniref:RagB/SusD family nutrient uptake outer membrane protein n=1 Tax=Pedobacter schmidteae TaxID=2201271 RepID=UPI0013CE8FCF|nr:RagB/SusD family nutrient uptake outer membrane protein [Pedobacter schmidteae]
MKTYKIKFLYHYKCGPVCSEFFATKFHETKLRDSIRIIFMGMILISLLCTSCKKFLDQTPDPKLVELKTLPDLQALLDDSNIMNLNTPGLGEVSCDDHFVTTDTYNSTTKPEYKLPYTWELEEYLFDVRNDWSVGYNAIFNANYALDYLQKIPQDSRNSLDWNNIKGSALFYKAYWYLNLLWVFSNSYDAATAQNDLGVVLRESADPTIPSKRSSVKLCYDKIIADLNVAIELLPDYPRYVTRPSKCAAYALLARTYLSMREYTNALKYADMSLKMKNDLVNYNDPSQVSTSSFFPFRPFNKEIIFFSSQGQQVLKSSLQALTDTLLYTSYRNEDIRKRAFFLPFGGYTTFKGNYNSNNFHSLFTGITTAEMFLIRSECYAREGKLLESMDDLTLLLKSRLETGSSVGFFPSDKEAAIDIVLKERRKELVKRGIRWPDIKRLNKEGRNIVLKRIVAGKVYTLEPNSPKYALPLPKDIVNFTGIPQNPR